MFGIQTQELFRLYKNAGSYQREKSSSSSITQTLSQIYQNSFRPALLLMDFADTNSCQKKYSILRSMAKQVGEKLNYLFIALSVPNLDVNKLPPWLRWLLPFDKIEFAPPRKWPLVSAWAHSLVGTGTWAQSRSCNHNWRYQIWQIEGSSIMCWLFGSFFLAQCTVYPPHLIDFWGP